MSAVRVLSGASFNNLSRALSVTASGEEPFYPAENVFLYDPSQPWKFLEPDAEGVTTPSITVDQALAQGDFEDPFTEGEVGSLVPDATWTKTGDGVSEQTAIGAEVHGGTGAALSIDVGTGLTQAVKTYTMRAGEQGHFSIALARGQTGTATANVQVYDPVLRMYLLSNGTWSATPTNIATSTSTTYAVVDVDFTMPALLTYLLDEVPLRVIVWASGGAGATDNAVFDDLFIWPFWDFAGVFGHTLYAGVVSIVEDSDDNSTYSTVETFTLGQPSFYKLSAAMNESRYVRLTMSEALAVTLGEFVVGQTVQLQKAQGFPLGQRHLEQDLYAEGLFGNPRSTNLAYHHRRQLGLSFGANRTEENFALWNVFRRSRGRTFPIVYIPEDDLAPVYFGRISNELPTSRTFNNRIEYSYEFRESAFFAE